MAVSQSEKINLSVLGSPFNDKAKHMPIKKRKFMFALPPPPCRSSSPHPEETQTPLETNLEAIDHPTSKGDLDQAVYTGCDKDDRSLMRASEQLAGCTNNFGGGNDSVKENFITDVSSELHVHSLANESDSLTEKISGEIIGCAPLSAEKVGPCVSSIQSEQHAAMSRIDNSSKDSHPQANGGLDKSADNHFVAVSKDNLTRKDEGADKFHVCSLRDDRLHWDLNTSMDTWEHPSNDRSADAYTSIADGTCEKNCSSKTESSKVITVERDSHMEDLKLCSCMNTDRVSCLPEKLPSCSSENVNFVSEDIVSPSVAGDRSASYPKSRDMISVDEVVGSGSCGEEDVKVPDDCQPLQSWPLGDAEENSLCQSNKVGLSESPAAAPVMPNSDALVVDSNMQLDNIPRHDTLENDNMLHEESEEAMKKSSKRSEPFLCKSFGPSPFDLANNSGNTTLEVSRGDHADLNESGIPVAFDFQFEDGELRESIEHTWEECDGEDIGAENMDYTSKDVNLGYTCEEIMGNAQGPGLEPCSSISTGNAASSDIETCHNIDSSPKEGADEATGVNGNVIKVDGIMNRGGNNVNMDGFNVEDHTMAESRPLRRELRSCIEERMSGEAVFWKESDADDLEPRSERGSGYPESFGRGRYARNGDARCQGYHRWIDFRDSNRGIKCHYSPNYHSSDFRRPGVENALRWRLARRGSPDTRDEAFGLRVRPSRDLSPGRHITFGRGRLIGYCLGVDGRGPRDRYDGSICNKSSLSHSHSSGKRERSFSPIERRRKFSSHRSASKSPPMSRSRSPDPGSPCFRRQNKSPTYRSELRLQRVGSPHQRPGAFADRVEGFRSFQRTRGCPPRNTRWTGDRKDTMMHFKRQGYNQHSSFLGRGSPERFGPRNQRIDFIDSPRSFRSGHPGSFMEMDRVVRGSSRYEGEADDRGRRGYREGPIHPIRRYDFDGSTKRLRYTVEDGLTPPRNSCYRDAPDFDARGSPKDRSRGIDMQVGDAPAEFGEDRGPFLYPREEGNNDVDSKPSAVQEGESEMPSEEIS